MCEYKNIFLHLTEYDCILKQKSKEMKEKKRKMMEKEKRRGGRKRKKIVRIRRIGIKRPKEKKEQSTKNKQQMKKTKRRRMRSDTRIHWNRGEKISTENRKAKTSKEENET